MSTSHDFGGKWTQRKLGAVRDYLNFYTKALKNQPFSLMYVDAFAGTGKVGQATKDEDGDLLVDLPERELMEGSARIALDLDIPFDRYVFFDTKSEHIDALEQLAETYSEYDVEIERHDANAALKALAEATDWHQWRAVVFLDPYGTQVEWETLVALAETQAVDVWLLVPFGMAYTRMLPNSGEVPDSWAERLTSSFGTDAWREAAYEETPSTIDMFGGSDKELRRKKLEDVEAWFIERLETIFERVSPPIYLENSNGTWLYSLYFAVASPTRKAQKLAFRAADYIIDKFGDQRGTG
ncbi:MAG: three-Cys-motif partner protein TcmP [Myxococcota bacterium]